MTAMPEIPSCESPVLECKSRHEVRAVFSEGAGYFRSSKSFVKL